MKGIQPYLRQKLEPLEQLLLKVDEWRNDGDSIGFTNGVFDLIHPGHVNYLQEASSYVDRLIIGLNSDSSVRRLNKGPDRPINGEDARALVLAGLASTSAIILFGTDTPLELIKSLRPDYLFKGGDYDASIDDGLDPKYIVGSAEVKEQGGTVMAIDIVEGFSTTGTLERILKDGH